MLRINFHTHKHFVSSVFSFRTNKTSLYFLILSLSVFLLELSVCLSVGYCLSVFLRINFHTHKHFVSSVFSFRTTFFKTSLYFLIVCLSFCSVCQSLLLLSVCLSVGYCLSVFLLAIVCQSFCWLLSVCLSVGYCLSVFLSFCWLLSVCLSVGYCLFVCEGWMDIKKINRSI